MSESSSDQSVYKSSNNEPDLDNVDPDVLENASLLAESSSDQSGYEGWDHEPDSDNVDPEFPEDGY